MTTPARLPLKTIPNVFLIAGDEAVEPLLPFLGEALQSGRVRVESISDEEAEARRRDGRMPTASALVHLNLYFRSGTATRARDRNETICGQGGCVTRPRTTFVQVPTLEALLVVRVREGTSNRILQEVRFEAEADADIVDVLQRDNVIRRLQTQLLETLDPQERSVRVRLQPFDLDGSDDILGALQQGEWTRGRRALEEMKSAADALRSEQRAAYYYDLGVARRFDPASLVADEANHFDEAEAALRTAVRLDPQPLYASALEDVRRHRDERALLAAQADAAGENFREAEGNRFTPPPPDSYQSR